MAPGRSDPEVDNLPNGRPWDDAAIGAIIERCKALPILDDRSDDEILGYDKNGLPG